MSTHLVLGSGYEDFFGGICIHDDIAQMRHSPNIFVILASSSEPVSQLKNYIVIPGSLVFYDKWQTRLS